MGRPVGRHIRGWTIAAWTLGATATLGPASVATAAPTQAAGTPDAAHSSDGTSEGPSLGAIIAGCFGVLFGGLIARWQIKAMQRRSGN